MRTREIGKLEWIDFVLSAVSSGLAAFTVGQGIKIPMATYVFGGLILIGTLVSALLHFLIPTRYQWAGGIFYFLVAIASIAAMEPLNSVFPDEGFPRVLLLAGGLSWMMSFGSFFLWSEATLTFQAVPAITLFGLVGAWDTFSGAPFAFFGFLICFAALFSRANARTMMRQAEDAGFGQYSADANLATGGTKKREKDHSRLLSALKNGPWRFMAGPEWALGSALVIVLFSLIGAPVVQMSMQGVAGTVRFNPAALRGQISAATESFGTSGGQTSIGTGPRPNLRKDPVFRVVNGPIDYYRLTTYADFRGRGWQEQLPFRDEATRLRERRDGSSLLSKSLDYNLERMDNIEYRVEFVQSLPRAPIVGVPNPMQMPNGVALRPDGTADWPQGRGEGQLGSWRVRQGEIPERAGIGLPEVFYGTGANVILSPRVRQFFQDAAKEGKTDWEKAMLLKRAIGRRIVYDLQALAVPPDKDPVDYVLFESRRGYCDLYATCMALGARVLGLPARYTTGFYPANLRREGSSLVLSEAEAHAWAEIYFEGFGWIALDPTEDAENNTERGDPTFMESFFEKLWVRTTGITLGLVLLVVGGWFAVKYLRRPVLSVDPARSEVAGAFREFYKAMEKGTGRPKRPSQTPQEYIEMVQPLLGENGLAAAEISSRLAHGMFARTPMESSEVQSLRREIQELRSRLRR